MKYKLTSVVFLQIMIIFSSGNIFSNGVGIGLVDDQLNVLELESLVSGDPSKVQLSISRSIDVSVNKMPPIFSVIQESEFETSAEQSVRHVNRGIWILWYQF